MFVNGVRTEDAELQWEANTEHNIIGYRVYRPGSLACPESEAMLSLALTCTDFGGPKKAEATYEIAALYRNAEGQVVEGAKATAKLPWPMPVAPNKPEPVEAIKNEDGSVTLTWPKISGAAFYRIYRESTNYASRYDVAPGSENPSYTDTDATVAHSYWVTAVNSNMHESAPVGPVTK